MTIEVQAHAESGRTLHKYAASDVTDACLYMTRQASVAWVDGYAVGGFGIVRIAHRPEHRGDRVLFSYLATDAGEAAFVEVDGGELAEVLRKRLYTLRPSDPRTI